MVLCAASRQVYLGFFSVFTHALLGPAMPGQIEKLNNLATYYTDGIAEGYGESGGEPGFFAYSFVGRDHFPLPPGSLSHKETPSGWTVSWTTETR